MSNILRKSGTESWKWPRSTEQGSIKPEMTRKKETYVEKKRIQILLWSSGGTGIEATEP